jgi:hypothetical protein
MHHASEREPEQRPWRKRQEVSPSEPKINSTTKKIGTPSGMVTAIACITDAVSTPRRTVALSAANDAADSSARNPPSTLRFLLLLASCPRLSRHDGQ